jgi:NAD(P)-dependent dehydrogenase (short-subunit alcohol dehydrogenase family)
MSTSELEGRHALVSGGGQGIGAAVARALAAQGACVTLLGRRLAPLQQQAAADPERIHAVAADVTDPDQLAAAFEAARERFGAVTILVNNAGQAESAPFERTSLEVWQRLLAVNLTGTMLAAQLALPDMRATSWGRIVNVASTAGLSGYAYVTAYCAAKHGVVGFTRALALETAKTGVTVNAVCPGYTDTALLRDSIANIVAKTGRTEAEAYAGFAANNPQGRLVQPEEVADAVRWLCGRGAAAITGQAIAVCGGEVT